ncbi:MAG: DUF4124 domain-containing protein [Sideroxydans sp.]|nr:DUF4124 domain-containing protein [Sideroxydans sp.]
MIDAKLLAGAALLVAFSLNAQAKLFKWVDDKGITHYGETIPPEYANKETMQLEKGRIEKREDVRDTANKKFSNEPVVDKSRIEAKRRDTALLDSYSSEKEIDLARDRNLQQVEARTNSYATLLKSSNENLASLQKEQDKLTRQGRKIPVSLAEDITEANTRITKYQADLDRNNVEAERIKARYAGEKARFRELKGLAPQ